MLRRGDDVDIDHFTIMFKDLKGRRSCAKRSATPRPIIWFDSILPYWRKRYGKNGAIVKTIGDAIMATFSNPLDGLNCGIQIHRDFETVNAHSGRTPVTIKVGLHVGRCISVTLNNRLDYYGTAANKAARLEGRVWAAMSFCTLKGFPGPVPYYRITEETLVSRRTAEASDGST